LTTERSLFAGSANRSFCRSAGGRRSRPLPLVTSQRGAVARRRSSDPTLIRLAHHQQRVVAFAIARSEPAKLRKRSSA